MMHHYFDCSHYSSILELTSDQVHVGHEAKAVTLASGN